MSVDTSQLKKQKRKLFWQSNGVVDGVIKISNLQLHENKKTSFVISATDLKN